jgi:glycosyltransferase involved in cell wall biosynthesis
MTDISIIITAHAEGVIAGPTIRSVLLAMEHLSSEGVLFECIVGLDRPTETTSLMFSDPSLNGWTIINLDYGDPFLVRNHLGRKANGEFIAFVDGDDLVSFNWFFRAVQKLREAQVKGERIIAHPELNWIFDKQNGVSVKVGQDDDLFCPHHFYFENYYDMMAVYPRSLLDEVPYSCRDVERGYGFQDWQWNLETIQRGWKHIVVEDTAIFKRRRWGSISEINKKREAVCRFVDVLAIDNIRNFPKYKN